MKGSIRGSSSWKSMIGPSPNGSIIGRIPQRSRVVSSNDKLLIGTIFLFKMVVTLLRASSE